MEGFRIAVKALLANQEVATTQLRFSATTLPTAAEMIAGADDLATFIGVDLAALYCSDITAFTIALQTFEHAIGPAPALTPYWAPTSADFGNGVATAIGPGTHAGSSLTPQCAVVASLRTALPGKSFQGRLFGFPPPESEVDSAGTIQGTHTWGDVVRDLADEAMATTFAAQGARFDVFSAKLDSSEEIILIAQGDRIDTQRRRLARSG